MNLKNISSIICVISLTATIAINSVSAADKNQQYNVKVGKTISVHAPSSYGGVRYRYILNDVSAYASVKSVNCKFSENIYYVAGLEKTNSKIKLFDVEIKKYFGKWHKKGTGWINVI